MRAPHGLAAAVIRRWPLAVIIIVAVLGGFLVAAVSGNTATVTLTASPGASIEPAGRVTASLGSTLTITVRTTLAGGEPGLMVDNLAVPLVASGATYTYALRVDGDREVAATVARLAPGTTLLDTATAAAITSISADGTRVTFRQTTPALDGLAPGGYLVNAVGSGLQRTLILKVVSVDRTGPGVVVTTMPAPITEVVRDASVQVDIPLVPAPVRTSYTGPMRLAADITDGLSFTVSTGLPAGCTEAPASPPGAGSCDVSIDGELKVANPRLSFVFETEWFSLKRFALVLELAASAKVGVTVGGAIQREMTPQLLSSIPLANAVIAIGPIPVWLQPGVDTLVGGDFDARAGVQFEGKLDISASVGPRYENGQADWVHDVTATPTGSVGLAGSAQAQGYVILRPRLTVDGMCDIYADVHAPFLRFKTDTDGGPNWALSAGLGLAGGGAHCNFLPAWTFDVAGDAERTLLSGRLFAAPTATSAPTIEPMMSPTSAPTAQPVVDATTAPTVAPVLTANLPVVACTTSDAGLMDSSAPFTPPASLPVRVTSDLAGDLAVYFVEESIYFLGPVDAQCTADIGVDRGIVATIRSSSDAQAIVSISSAFADYLVLEWACHTDATAAARFRSDQSDTCAVAPRGETIIATGPGIVGFTELPGVTGSFVDGVSAYGTVGQLTYSLSTPSAMGFAQVRACSLPVSQARVCEALLHTDIQAP